jgi:hypothetical protein
MNFLCDQEPETIDHIIVTCSFSQQIWWNVATALQRPMIAFSLRLVDSLATAMGRAREDRG